jgi:hypothetical protein
VITIEVDFTDVELREELLDGRYLVLGEEMLWREYERFLRSGGSAGVRDASRVLRVIREAPD